MDYHCNCIVKGQSQPTIWTSKLIIKKTQLIIALINALVNLMFDIGTKNGYNLLSIIAIGKRKKIKKLQFLLWFTVTQPLLGDLDVI